MKLEHGTLVLVMDGAKMLLFSNEGDTKYPVLETLAYEEGERLPSHEQGRDRPGRSFSSTESRRSAYSETDWHDEGEKAFLRDALRSVEASVSQTDGAVMVIATPAALGEIRQHYSPALAKRICAEIDKDVAHGSTDAILAVIAAYDQAD